MLTERNLDLEEKVRELRETVGDLVRTHWLRELRVLALSGWEALCSPPEGGGRDHKMGGLCSHCVLFLRPEPDTDPGKVDLKCPSNIAPTSARHPPPAPWI